MEIEISKKMIGVIIAIVGVLVVSVVLMTTGESSYHSLTVDIEGSGQVSIEPDQDEYKQGARVTLASIPDDDWHLYEWTGDVEEYLEEEIEIMMDQDKEITSVFMKRPSRIVEKYISANSEARFEEVEQYLTEQAKQEWEDDYTEEDKETREKLTPYITTEIDIIEERIEKDQAIVKFTLTEKWEEGWTDEIDLTLPENETEEREIEREITHHLIIEREEWKIQKWDEALEG